ncbi:MAG: tRNA pseudouridine(38-40) synthase TruA [Clostridia bacterium]|nr:tRNA pseudouridine(38-40) synthase TruA [Clostridia bacterium]
MRYRAVISYFGTRYVGWQRQLNGLSVQEVLEKALEKTFGAPTQATASGRTDAGVHAEGQVVHFDAETSIPVDKIPFAVNTELPDDVSMLYCEVAEPDFNSRFNAKRKTYRYSLYLSKHPRPMLEATHEHIVVPLDLAAMEEAAKVIEGEHDFKCFEASGSNIKSTVRTVYEVAISLSPLDKVASISKDTETGNLNGSFDKNAVFDCRIEISVTGNGFLYNMVRIIAGTLVYVGLHKLTAQDVQNIIETGDRKRAGKTLSAKGLCLVKVVY